MFPPINKPFDPLPMMLGLLTVSGGLGLMLLFQVFWLQALDLRAPVPDIITLHVIRPRKPRLNAAVARSWKKRSATVANEKNAHSPTTSVVPGTLQWRQHVERGRSLDFEIVAEQSLPVLRANGVPLAMDVHRPRGNTLLYNLQSGTLSRGVVADDAVAREVEGLPPSEFAEPLREAERELGARPRVWALYPNDLFSALRSLTQDALQQEAVPMDSVKMARVRLSLVGGRAFAVMLVSHY